LLIGYERGIEGKTRQLGFEWDLQKKMAKEEGHGLLTFEFGNETSITA
jgi:hypothetical protein